MNFEQYSDQLYGKQHSLFDTDRALYITNDAFAEIRDVRDNSMLFNTYRSYITEYDLEIKKAEDMRQAAILACAKCMNSSVLTTFSAAKYEDIVSAYFHDGFTSDVVHSYLRDIKSSFFRLLSDNPEVLSRIICTDVSRNRNICKFDKHLISYFKYDDGLDNKNFALGIPIRENSVFGSGNYRDETLGRFLLIGNEKAVLPLTIMQGIKNTSIMPTQFRCLAASFDPGNIASALRTYLTIDTHDNSESSIQSNISASEKKI